MRPVARRSAFGLRLGCRPTTGLGIWRSRFGRLGGRRVYSWLVRHVLGMLLTHGDVARLSRRASLACLIGLLLLARLRGLRILSVSLRPLHRHLLSTGFVELHLLMSGVHRDLRAPRRISLRRLLLLGVSGDLGLYSGLVLRLLTRLRIHELPMSEVGLDLLPARLINGLRPLPALRIGKLPTSKVSLGLLLARQSGGLVLSSSLGLSGGSSLSGSRLVLRQLPRLRIEEAPVGKIGLSLPPNAILLR